MIKAQLKNLIKTIHLVKEAGFSLNGSLYMELLYDFTHDELVHNPIIESTVDTIQSVEFERISFSYNGKDNVINDISFSIKAGERLAIVGGNGSGKSTIFKLACGLYDNYEGNIYINGINLCSIQKKSYYKRISALFQDFLKYELTLRENVGLGELSKLYSDESYNTSFFTTSWDSENELRLEDIYIRYSDGKFHFTTIDESIKRD